MCHHCLLFPAKIYTKHQTVYYTFSFSQQTLRNGSSNIFKLISRLSKNFPYRASHQLSSVISITKLLTVEKFPQGIFPLYKAAAQMKIQIARLFIPEAVLSVDSQEKICWPSENYFFFPRYREKLTQNVSSTQANLSSHPKVVSNNHFQNKNELQSILPNCSVVFKMYSFIPTLPPTDVVQIKWRRE